MLKRVFLFNCLSARRNPISFFIFSPFVDINVTSTSTSITGINNSKFYFLGKPLFALPSFKPCLPPYELLNFFPVSSFSFFFSYYCVVFISSPSTVAVKWRSILSSGATFNCFHKQHLYQLTTGFAKYSFICQQPKLLFFRFTLTA